MNKEINCSEFPFPCIIIDENKNIIFSNEKFNKVFQTKDDKVSELKMNDIIENYNYKIKEQKAIIRAKCYNIFTIPFENNNNNLYYIFLIENTCSELEDCAINNILVGLIFIDNYTEVLDSIEDIRHPLLIALIDRKINSMMYNIGGIVRKFEKDKYFIVFTYDKLEYLKENKFEVLDQVREIDMGNSIPVTLSIGIGLNGKTLSQSMEYARAAIDLALSRGGDQVLIKDSEKYHIFGGKGKEVGSNTRVRARVKAYALSELIEESENVIIMGHRNIDLDCLGASIGVFKIADTMNKKSNIVLDKVTTSIKQYYDRLMTEDKKYCNFVFVSSDEAMEMITEKTLLIIVDFHRPSIAECPEIIKKASKIVVFDHHRKSADFIDNAVLTYHEPYASSTCELITEMLLYVNREFKLTKTEADGLLAGITVDTKNFAFKTGTKTFEAAAYLRRHGADTIRVKMLFQNSLENFRQKAEAVANAKIFNGNMAISVTKTNIENPQLLAAQTSDELLNIMGIEASFVLCHHDEGIAISARSLGNINVQVIMEKLGGGGHQTVSGAQFNDCSIDEVIIKLEKAIDEYLQEVN